MRIFIRDVPEFLTESNFYRDLNENDEFDIDDKFFKENDVVKNIKDFSLLLNVILFWDTDKIPRNLYRFYRDHPDDVFNRYINIFTGDISVENLLLYDFFSDLSKMEIISYEHFMVNGKILDLLEMVYLKLKESVNNSKEKLKISSRNDKGRLVEPYPYNFIMYGLENRTRILRKSGYYKLISEQEEEIYRYGIINHSVNLESLADISFRDKANFLDYLYYTLEYNINFYYDEKENIYSLDVEIERDRVNIFTFKLYSSDDDYNINKFKKFIENSIKNKNLKGHTYIDGFNTDERYLEFKISTGGSHESRSSSFVIIITKYNVIEILDSFERLLKQI